MDAIFRPKSVAVIGASSGVSATGAPKMGAAAFDHLVDHRFEGDIYPVNPGREEIRGYKCYPSLLDIPGDVDLALIVVPAKAAVEAMRQCSEKGVKSAIVFSSGFSETGDHDLEADLIEAAQKGGVRFVGPNTAGLIGLDASLTACISMACAINPFSKGNVAFVTQSGALGGSMLARGMDDGVGFSHWVATGNESDLEAADYIDYFLDDDEVKVIALFLEGVRDTDRFIASCEKALRLQKPIIVYKTGLSDISAAATVSHTGAMAGSNEVFNAVCRRYGLIRVEDAADLLPTAKTFSLLSGKIVNGRRVGIISASGGICGVAADDCHRYGLDIPELTEQTKEKISEFVPSFAALRNPIDVTGQIRSFATGYQDTVKAVLAEDYIDGVLLLITMAAEPRATFYGEEISKIAAESDKPVIVGWSGGLSLASNGYPMLAENGVPTFTSTSGAVKAMSALADYGAAVQRMTERQK